MEHLVQSLMPGTVDQQANHFIPITRYEIIDFLRKQEADMPLNETGIEEFSVYLSAWRHQHYHEKLSRLKQIYMPFSPDRDTVNIHDQSDRELASMKGELVTDIEWLMNRANYSRIDEANLDGLFREKSDYGLDLTVNLDSYEDLIIYYRGCKTEKAGKRSLKSLYLSEKIVEVPVFVRLFLLIKLKPEHVRIAEMVEKQGLSERAARRKLKRYRELLSHHIFSVDDQLIEEIQEIKGVDKPTAAAMLKKYRKLLCMPQPRRVRKLMRQDKISQEDAISRLAQFQKIISCVDLSNYVYIKVFKNIPREDLEMMFPTTRVHFKLYDKIKLSLTTGAGVGTSIYGSVTGGGSAVATGGGILSGLLAIPYAITMAIGGLALVIFKQVSEFFNQRTKYSMELARRLYFHSLADNRGALTLMIDRAEEQDLKEDLLLYYALSKQSWPINDLPGLDTYIQQFIKRDFGVDADFDINDALERMKADGLVKETPDGQFVTLSPDSAISHLKQLLNDRLEVLRKNKHNSKFTGELDF